MNRVANTTFEAAKESFASHAQGLRHTQLEDLPGWVRNYIVEHPGLTAAQIICLVILAVPAIITMPLLGALGFTSLGPAAGTAAAWFQATFGATAVFSTLQSYMMAGTAFQSSGEWCKLALRLLGWEALFGPGHRSS
ncbi:hypothetical protein BTJ68_13740 [Hortaea werneckii EXF-2000]|uniref:Uncharacterized protein n=1 Tax=Hortaea werneckii EXF-2000 TaxID=1157616 RepID=A0A1Z5SU27_HORWE|nr:hypothetical protein BTJ68_13740 [Hortaea werneckii EXF-2000]